MVVAAVFAGGSGSRMGNTETPKQYLKSFLFTPALTELLFSAPVFGLLRQKT